MKFNFNQLALPLLNKVQLRILFWFLGGEPRLCRKFVGTCFRFAVVVKDKKEHHARARWFACGMNRA
jgi:hypothetical protein